MAFLDPVQCVGDQEDLDFRTSVIVDLGSPVRMLTLSRVFMLIDSSSIEIGKSMCILREMVESIYGNAPDEIKEIYKKILWSLLMKLKVPNEETSNIKGEIGGRGMGYLFENMDEMDIQAERRNTAREKKRADALEEEVKRLRKLLEIQGQK